jgi:Tfp pilus assembly protein PilX
MNHAGTRSNKVSQQGIALLTAIFVLMLISVVALSMMLSSGTESSIAGNYRLATQSYYAAYSGLEEARGRLWSKHPNAFGTLIPNPMSIGTAIYVTNPAGSETVAPTNATNAYYDSEYYSEFGVQASALGSSAQSTASVSSLAGFPGPLYKWVRITPRTEQSSNMDIDNDGNIDPTLPIMYDGLHQFVLGTFPTLANEPTGQKQVYTLTALAVLPNGAKRILQEDVAMKALNFSFPGALTLDGNNPTFTAPTSVPFVANGDDHSPGGATCPPPQASRPAVGVVNTPDISTTVSGIPSNRLDNYTGGGLATPSVGNISSGLPTSETTPAGLESFVQQIESTADYIVQGPASSLPSYGTVDNPVTVVVDSANNGATGNLSLSGNITGYGILVVRGVYSPGGTVGWNGIVLVIGQGDIEGSGGGNNSYNGGVFLAKTRDASGNLLSTLGTPTFNWSGGGGNGIFYNSCSINNANNNQTFQMLSFHEIPQ